MTGVLSADMGSRPSALIVDDDPDIRHALRLLFEFEDFEVVAEAANGVDAISCAIKYQPDIVVLDYKMPRLTGETSAHVIRALVPDARIVAFSAILETKPHWADAFLNKERISEIAPLLSTLVANDSAIA